MQGDINREVFPTFLAKKSYDWWITRRRMEIYTKISHFRTLELQFRTLGLGVRNSHALDWGIRTLLSSCEIVPQLDAVVFRRLYLPHSSSKSYMVWIVGFLTFWALKYIACRKWTSGSAPKVPKKTAASVLYFPPCFSLLLFGFLCFSPLDGLS